MKSVTGPLVKGLIFTVVTLVATIVLGVTIANKGSGDTISYSAKFTDVTSLNTGDDIRMSGVRVGQVEDIEVVDRKFSQVEFSVDRRWALSPTAIATVKFRNLIGQRYISIDQGTGSGTLPEDSVIPLDRTRPALDLTAMFNGFKPLFQALSPDDVNKLSYEVVQVFQGEGGTLENLLGHTASITQTLADRDQVIGDLIDNLDYVLDHIADRDDQLSDLIVTFRTLVSGLKDDREAILASLDGISALSVQTADLVKGIRPYFVEDVKQLRRVAGNVDRNKAELDRALQVLPIKLEKIGRTAIYGSWFNFYLCEFKAHVTLPGNVGVVNIPNYVSGANRCDLG